MQASDVYSLALVLWEIFSGCIPYDNGNMKFSDMENMILSGQRPFSPLGMIPFQSLVEMGWGHDPASRVTYISHASLL